MNIFILDEKHEKDYSKYLLEHDDTFFYVSIAFKKFLQQYLGDEPVYVVAENEYGICGVLPCFIHENKKYGNVINSLPYYGSNGGIISDNEEAREALIGAYFDIMKKRDCVAGTMITSPYRNDENWYRNRLKPDFVDKRISMICNLPTESDDTKQAILDMYHKSPKQGVVKAQKNNIECAIENTEEAFDELWKIHTDNMLKVGGIPKAKHFFDMVQKCFEAGKDYNVYVGRKDGIIVSVLLLFYYNRTVEYFTPGTLDEYKSVQPLSLLIYKAMIDAVNNGYFRWNWGGTHLDMNGVYEYKRKFGSVESEYFYYTNISDSSITKLDRERISLEYPFYFIYPFNGGIEKNVWKSEVPEK